MIVELLNAIAEFLIRSLKGFISFLEVIIPLILKILFSSSPFVALIFLSYSLGGVIIAGISTAVVIFIILVGIGWAVKKKITDTKMTAEIIGTVLILDALFISIPILYQKGFLQSETSLSETVNQTFEIPAIEDTTNLNDNETDHYKLKAKQFNKFLEESISKNDAYNIVRAINELKTMKYTEAIPQIMNALKKYYPKYDVTYTPKWENNVSTSSISALVELEGKEACQLLYEIQARKPALYQVAKDATAQICE